MFLTGDPYNVSILENRNLHVIANRGSGFHSDKKNYLDEILEQYNCSVKETAYVGDDLFDIGIVEDQVFMLPKKCPQSGKKNQTFYLQKVATMLSCISLIHLN